MIIKMISTKFVNIPKLNFNPSNLCCFNPWLEASKITLLIFFFLKFLEYYLT